MAVPRVVDPVDPRGIVGSVLVWPGLEDVARVVSPVERAGTGVALLAGDPGTTVLPVCVLVCVGVGTAVEEVLEAVEAVGTVPAEMVAVGTVAVTTMAVRAVALEVAAVEMVAVEGVAVGTVAVVAVGTVTVVAVGTVAVAVVVAVGTIAVAVVALGTVAVVVDVGTVAVVVVAVGTVAVEPAAVAVGDVVAVGSVQRLLQHSTLIL